MLHSATGERMKLDKAKPKPHVGELGATGTEFFRGFIKNDEYNPKLQGKAGFDTITNMLTDAQVTAANSVYTLPVKGATWQIDAEDPAIKRDLHEALFQRISFPQMIDHALLGFTYGFEVMEKVFEVDDGKHWYKKLAHRSQKTIDQWHTDENGDLTGITQRTWKAGTYKTIDIPASNLFHLGYDQIGNNFVGRSGLRSAYKYWYIKENVERIAAIAMERFGLGVPAVTSPEDYDEKDKSIASKLAKNYRAGAKAYLYLPKDWEFNILGQGDSARYDPMPLIRYCDEGIATAALAMVLVIGRTFTGSFALAKSLLDLFQLALEGVADWVQENINRQLVRPFLCMNYPDGENIKAAVRWSNLVTRNVETIATALERLQRGGFVQADEELEAWLRTILKAPQQGGKPAPKASLPTHSHRPQRLAKDSEFWRDPTDLEKFVSLRELDGRQTDTEEAIADIVEKEKAVWVSDLVQQIEVALSDGDPSDIIDIEIPKGMRRKVAGDLVTLQRDLFRYGQQTIRDEQKRQKRAEDLSLGLDDATSIDDATIADRLAQMNLAGMPNDDVLGQLRELGIALRDESAEDEEVTQSFWARARSYLDTLASRITSVAKEMAQGLFRTKKEEVEQEDLDTIESDLMGMFTPAARNAAKPMVSEAFNLGRDRQAQKLIELIELAEYSALMDDPDTCKVCFDDDGKTFQVGTKEYYAHMPPNPDCESTKSGENRCRCFYNYRFKPTG